jgi:hypothetical protein
VYLTKYYLDHQIKNNEMGRACSTYGERKDVCRVLVGKPEGNRLPVRPRCTREDNIKMYLQEVG